MSLPPTSKAKHDQIANPRVAAQPAKEGNTGTLNNKEGCCLITFNHDIYCCSAFLFVF